MSVDGLILRSARLADLYHQGHVRKYSKTPYIYHPMRVAGRTTLLPGAGPIEISAAWLHDTIEMNANVTEKVLIEEGVPQAVVSLVGALSNVSRSMAGTSTRKERKKADFEYLARQTDWVKKIKLVDRIDNLIGLSFNDPEWMRIYCEESKLLLDNIGQVDKGLSLETQELIDWCETELIRRETSTYGYDGM